MKWFDTKLFSSPFNSMKWAIFAGLLPMAFTAARASSTGDALRCDSSVVIRTDSATTIELPDSVIRKAALKIGMIDTTNVTEKIKFMGHLHPDTTLYSKKSFSKYDKRRIRNQKRWNKLIPNQTTLQFAGSIGMLSAGIGWHYGRGDHWESEFLIGFLPKFQSCEAHTTFTLKQRYVPWHCKISSRWTIEPLTTGIFFNTISGDEFWKRLPDVYPNKYYTFPTKVRTNIFIGQRFRYRIPHKKRILNQAISFYYEISTCDLYLVSKVTNKDFPWRDTFSLAFGLRWDM